MCFFIVHIFVNVQLDADNKKKCLYVALKLLKLRIKTGVGLVSPMNTLLASIHSLFTNT
jgi:hypothetical protein